MNVEHFRCPLDTCDYWRFVNADAPDVAEVIADEDTALHAHFETHSNAEVLDQMRAMVRERMALRRIADKIAQETLPPAEGT